MLQMTMPDDWRGGGLPQTFVYVSCHVIIPFDAPRIFLHSLHAIVHIRDLDVCITHEVTLMRNPPWKNDNLHGNFSVIALIVVWA